MVDIDAAIGFVVARGDAVDRARLAHIRAGTIPAAEIYANIEARQTGSGGWPAQSDDSVASIDATCFRLAELDDLAGLGRQSARRALDWIGRRQRLDGFWEEDPALHASAPLWAKPGDPEARFYLTANAAYWLAVGGEDDEFETHLTRAAEAMRDSLEPNGAWPGFLVSGWLAAAVMHRTEWFYESARMFVVLSERVATMSAADVAWMAAALRRAGVSTDDSLMVAARNRLSATQRPDGAWPSDDGTNFDVHTTLTALRACR
jgi:hypothetical protein